MRRSRRALNLTQGHIFFGPCGLTPCLTGIIVTCSTLISLLKKIHRLKSIQPKNHQLINYHEAKTELIMLSKCSIKRHMKRENTLFVCLFIREINVLKVTNVPVKHKEYLIKRSRLMQNMHHSKFNGMKSDQNLLLNPVKHGLNVVNFNAQRDPKMLENWKIHMYGN